MRVRIDFAKHSHVGPGKIELLEAIRHAGSLSQAARDLGISYRHAWQLAESLKSAFQPPVTLATRGGSGGGSTRLFPCLRRIIDCGAGSCRRGGVAERTKSSLGRLPVATIISAWNLSSWKRTSACGQPTMGARRLGQVPRYRVTPHYRSHGSFSKPRCPASRAPLSHRAHCDGF